MKRNRTVITCLLLFLRLIASAQENNHSKILNLPADTLHVKQLRKISNQFIADKNYDSAFYFNQKALQVSAEIKFEESVIQCYSDAFTIYLLQDKDSLALLLLNNAEKKCRELKYRHGLAPLYLPFSNYYSSKGEWPTAIKFSNYILANCDSVKEASLYAATLSNIGKFNNFIGNSNDGINAFLRGLKIAETAKDSFRISVIYNNMAMLYNNIGDAEKSKEYCYKSIAVKKRYDQAGLYFPYQNLGYVYNTLALNYDSSLYYYRLAESLADAAGNKMQLGNIYQNLSAIFDRKEMNDSSMLYAQKSLDINMSIGNNHNIASSLNVLGVRYKQMAERTGKKSFFNESLKYYMRALYYAEQSGGIWKQNTYVNLSQLYQATGDFKNALKYELLSRVIKDSLLNNEIVNSTAKLEAKYEAKKKEIEIAKLNSEKLLDAEKIARQKTLNYSLLAIAVLILISGFLIFRNVQKKRTAEKQVAILEKQNAIENMCSTIASDLHDNIGSTLSSISVYSQVAHIKNEANNKEELNEVLEKISLTSGDMMAEMNDTVWAINPRNDSMEKIIQRMESFAKPLLATRNISFKLHCEPAVLTTHLEMDKRKNFYLIFKEALNNAFKYADCSEFVAEISTSNRQLVLTLKDNGAGFNVQHEMAENKLTLSGNGLRNMRMRAEEMTGDLYIESEPGAGTKIRLIIPIP